MKFLFENIDLWSIFLSVIIPSLETSNLIIVEEGFVVRFKSLLEPGETEVKIEDLVPKINAYLEDQYQQLE